MLTVRCSVVVGLALLVLGGAYAFAGQAAGRRVAVQGQVVDAACFMMHPPAASIPSHKDCAAACMNRGVPIAILNQSDQQLYFPADGNKRLVQHLGRRVQAAGTVVRKGEPMVLKMAVGEKSEMAVTVTGGYNVLTMESVSLATGK